MKQFPGNLLGGFIPNLGSNIGGNLDFPACVVLSYRSHHTGYTPNRKF